MNQPPSSPPTRAVQPGDLLLIVTNFVETSDLDEWDKDRLIYHAGVIDLHTGEVFRAIFGRDWTRQLARAYCKPWPIFSQVALLADESSKNNTRRRRRRVSLVNQVVHTPDPQAARAVLAAQGFDPPYQAQIWDGFVLNRQRQLKVRWPAYGSGVHVKHNGRYFFLHQADLARHQASIPCLEPSEELNQAMVVVIQELDGHPQGSTSAGSLIFESREAWRQHRTQLGKQAQQGRRRDRKRRKWTHLSVTIA